VLDHHDLCDLCGVIGVFPDPSAAGVAGSEGVLHRGTKRFCINSLPGLKMWQQAVCRMD